MLNYRNPDRPFNKGGFFLHTPSKFLRPVKPGRIFDFLQGDRQTSNLRSRTIRS